MNSDIKNSLLSNCFIHLFILFVVVLAAYYNSFDAPFTFDDLHNIVENPIIRELRFFIAPEDARAIVRDPEKITSLYTAFRFRFVGYLTFALNYKFHALHVWGYHLINISIHLINGFIFYFFVLLVLQTPQLCDRQKERDATFMALVLSLIFVAHPLQTQAVTYIVQRFASLAAMFYLLTLTIYAKWRAMLYRGEADSVKAKLFYILAIVSAVLGMRTKETVFTLPLMICLFDYLFYNEKKRRIVYLLPFLITMVIVPLSLFALDSPVGGSGEKLRMESEISRADYLMTEFCVIATYLRLILFPVQQNLDYNYPIYESFFTPAVLLSLFLHLLIVGGSLSAYFRFAEKEPLLRVTAFGVLFYYLSLSVESSFVPINDVIFEHRVYLPLAGFLLTFGSFILKVRGRLFNRYGLLLVVVTILVLTFATHKRNHIWRNSLRLWEDVTIKSPGKARPYKNLGAAYFNKGDHSKALEMFDRALTIDFSDPELHFNRGLIFELRGKTMEAVSEYKLALKYEGHTLKALNNLAWLYATSEKSEIRDGEEAVKLAKRGCEYTKYKEPMLLDTLATAYASVGNYDLALKFANQALKEALVIGRGQLADEVRERIKIYEQF